MSIPSRYQHARAEELRKQLARLLKCNITMLFTTEGPYRAGFADMPGDHYVAGNFGGFKTDNRPRLTLCCPAPPPADVGELWPLVSLPLDVEDFDSLVDAGGLEGTYEYERLSGRKLVDNVRCSSPDGFSAIRESRRSQAV